MGAEKDASRRTAPVTSLVLLIQKFKATLKHNFTPLSSYFKKILPDKGENYHQQICFHLCHKQYQPKTCERFLCIFHSAYKLGTLLFFGRFFFFKNKSSLSFFFKKHQEQNLPTFLGGDKKQTGKEEDTSSLLQTTPNVGQCNGRD